MVIRLASIPDVQALPDTRNLSIDKVGIRDIRQPVKIIDRSGLEQPTIATFGMFVQLAPEVKGTHMSRFVEVLEENEGALSLTNFPELIQAVAERLNADHCEVEMSFPYFMEKAAPVTGVKSTLDFQVTMICEWDAGNLKQQLTIEVPVTSLCPCSKTISDYGAHNQRSLVSATVEIVSSIWIDDLISVLEVQGSCELYPILKRPDEKYVPERAFENPKFVEAIARDVAMEFNTAGMYRAHIDNEGNITIKIYRD